MTNKARTLLGKGRRRIRRTFSTDEERGVTAEHWGEDAREKAESEDWQGLYWQSYVLTQQHINRDISGDPTENWVNFTKRRFFPSASDLALSLGCGYGASSGTGSRSTSPSDSRPSTSRPKRSRSLAARPRARARRPVYYEVSDLNAIELEPGRYGAVFAAQALHHIEALEHLLDQIRPR